MKNIVYGKRTYIMGILNMTPDSFSDGGSYDTKETAVNKVARMLEEGADIIDIGGESTRPGHTVISDEEEISRILPILRAIKEGFDVGVSVDTYKSGVAYEALKNGADMINDIWGLRASKDMASIIADFDAEVCIMHNRDNTVYEGDLMDEIKAFLSESIELALKSNIKESNIVLDPGIGFGKTFEQNLETLRRMEELKELGFPILLGTSRKSFLGKLLDIKPSERDVMTAATTAMGIERGADIVRVHDVWTNKMAAIVADSIHRGL